MKAPPEMLSTFEARQQRTERCRCMDCGRRTDYPMSRKEPVRCSICERAWAKAQDPVTL